MDYLHWIGKQHYTQHSFAKEAVQYGVTRRVSLNIAQQMNWGDTVYCAMLDGKTGVVFGYFTIDKLSGLSPFASTLVTSIHENKLIDEGGETIDRGCGSYTTDSTHAVRGELPDIIDILANAHYEYVDIGHPMVGGFFYTTPKIRLLDIPFRPGFRTIGAKALLYSASVNDNKVHGQFYVQNDVARPLLSDHLKECGWIQAVANYKQSKRIKPRKTQKTLKKKE